MASKAKDTEAVIQCGCQSGWSMRMNWIESKRNESEWTNTLKWSKTKAEFASFFVCLQYPMLFINAVRVNGDHKLEFITRREQNIFLRSVFAFAHSHTARALTIRWMNFNMDHYTSVFSTLLRRSPVLAILSSNSFNLPLCFLSFRNLAHWVPFRLSIPAHTYTHTYTLSPPSTSSLLSH